MQVGEVAYISFTNATSVPLYIATTNGTYYEMHVVCSNTSGSNSSVYLNPNNTSYSNAFTYLEYWIGTNGSNSSNTTFSAFRIGWGAADITVFIANLTTFKSTRSTDICLAGAPIYHTDASLWNDTTTSWTSLGTITFAQAISGYVLVRRLA